MKQMIFFMAIGLSAISCSQKDKTQSTRQADYAETREKLIDNHIPDSLKADSMRRETAMPAQANPKEQNK